jgi:aryl-alcohol dehydrogenase-like predicted oxidoreductase
MPPKDGSRERHAAAHAPRSAGTAEPGLTRGELLRGAAGALGALALGRTAIAQGKPQPAGAPQSTRDPPPDGAPSAGPAAERMLTRRIPSTGQRLPVVGCGTWRTFDVGPGAAERAPLAEVLRVLFESGGTMIDTSPMYDPAETVVGDLLAAGRSRERAFIATKVWTTGRLAGLKQMRRSLDLLRTDRIELMQIHNLVDWRTHLPALREWKQEGRFDYVGITHYLSSAHEEMEAIMRSEALDFVQLSYALNDRDAEQRLLPLAADRGIAIVANQPFGGGGLLRTMLPKPLPPWAGEIGCRSWPQLLLKFVLGHPAVTCVIPGTGRPEHMRDNVRAGFGPLPGAAHRKKFLALLGA